MSIVESLKKLVDPVAARERDVELKQSREQPTRDDSAGPEPERMCRVCGHRGREPIFCPECLAETMRPVRNAADSGK